MMVPMSLSIILFLLSIVAKYLFLNSLNNLSLNDFVPNVQNLMINDILVYSIICDIYSADCPAKNAFLLKISEKVRYKNILCELHSRFENQGPEKRRYLRICKLNVLYVHCTV